MQDTTTIKMIKAKYDSMREWKADPKGYFTIRPFYEEDVIRVRFHNYRKDTLLIIEGRCAEEIYITIIREGLVSKLEHAAYLGSELQKAEIALRDKIRYVQDSSLEIKNNKI